MNDWEIEQCLKTSERAKNDNVGLLPEEISDAQVSNGFGRIPVQAVSKTYLHKSSAMSIHIVIISESIVTL